MPQCIRSCPVCGDQVSIRKLTCVCGHSFRRKRSFFAKSSRDAVLQQRISETEEQASKRRAANRRCQAIKRSLETEEERSKRRAASRKYQALRRSQETAEQTRKRRAANGRYQALKRTLETEEETSKRRAAERKRKALKRSQETEEEVSKRRAVDRRRQALKRSQATKEMGKNKACNRKCNSLSSSSSKSELQSASYIKLKRSPETQGRSSEREILLATQLKGSPKALKQSLGTEVVSRCPRKPDDSSEATNQIKEKQSKETSKQETQSKVQKQKATTALSGRVTSETHSNGMQNAGSTNAKSNSNLEVQRSSPETGLTLSSPKSSANLATSKPVASTNTSNVLSQLQQLVDKIEVSPLALPNLTTKSPQVSMASKGQSFQVSKRGSTTCTDNRSLAFSVPGKEQNKAKENSMQQTKQAIEMYRNFVLKQAHSKRMFKKRIELKMLLAPFPKAFRQVWPIIPVNDPLFMSNFGLEGVIEHLSSIVKSQTPKAPPKVKPVCNQCNCDFASAWQVRKGNSKQLLLCEACDSQNLKILQCSNLSDQLKELLGSVRKEEEQFNQECEESKKQVIELEKHFLLSLNDEPPPLTNQLTSVEATNVPKVSSHSVVVDGNKVSANGDQQHPLISSILVQRHHTQELLAVGENVQDLRKRKDTSDMQPPPSKSFKPGSALDQPLIKLSESLTNKKRQDSQPKYPLKVEAVSMETNVVPNTVAKTPVVMDTKSLSAAESQKNRRKGTPKRKKLLRSSSAIGE